MTTHLQTIFNAYGACRIVALAGSRNCGKTNNLVALVKDFRDKGNTTPVYFYGFVGAVRAYLSTLGCVEVSSIEHLTTKKDSILILDEVQRLKLNDKRYRDLLNAFCDFIYHNNNYCILSSPNLREFNSVIGGKIERWLLKTCRLSECINGSQLKRAIESNQGQYKVMNDLVVAPGELLIINGEEEKVLKLEYVPQADTKKGLVDVFKGNGSGNETGNTSGNIQTKTEYELKPNAKAQAQELVKKLSGKKSRKSPRKSHKGKLTFPV